MEDKSKYQLRYLVMPDYIYSDKRLSDIARRTYCFIHSYTNSFFFSNDHLSKMFNCHPDTISTAVKQLESFGLIKITYKRKTGGGKTRICVDAVSESVLTPIDIEKPSLSNRSKHPDKDIKDNNKRENFLDNDALTQKRLAREYRNSRKGKGLGGYSALQVNHPKFEKKVKAGTYAEDIR